MRRFLTKCLIPAGCFILHISRRAAEKPLPGLSDRRPPSGPDFPTNLRLNFPMNSRQKELAFFLPLC